MAYARDNGDLICLVCGKGGIGRSEQGIKSHERGKQHKQAQNKTMTEPIQYPNAVWKPLGGHSAAGTLAQRNTIVLHITAGSTMEGAFQTFKASVAPKRVSAHFIIDRDGTVYQLMSISETAWHASAVNAHSVGIEHVAVPGSLPATEEQYAASALLVQWLCGMMNVPIDRNHVRGHNEASPADGHKLCCSGALSADRVVSMAVLLPKEIPT